MIIIMMIMMMRISFRISTADMKGIANSYDMKVAACTQFFKMVYAAS